MLIFKTGENISILVISGFKSKIDDQVTEIFTFFTFKSKFLLKYFNDFIFKVGNGKNVRSISLSKDILASSSDFIFCSARPTNFCLSTNIGIISITVNRKRTIPKANFKKLNTI